MRLGRGIRSSFAISADCSSCLRKPLPRNRDWVRPLPYGRGSVTGTEPLAFSKRTNKQQLSCRAQYGHKPLVNGLDIEVVGGLVHEEEYEHLGGYTLESQAREVLHGLGFNDEQIDGDVGLLSGGWKMRVALARVLLGSPGVLLTCSEII